MRAVASTAAAAVVALVVGMPAPAQGPAPPANEWLALARDMAKPWPALAHENGADTDYVIANAPPGPPRDPYGRAFMGLALLQTGIRDGGDTALRVALRSLVNAADHPVNRDRIVFENLALATAYNLARAHLKTDKRWLAARPALER